MEDWSQQSSPVAQNSSRTEALTTPSSGQRTTGKRLLYTNKSRINLAQFKLKVSSRAGMRNKAQQTRHAPRVPLASSFPSHHHYLLPHSPVLSFFSFSPRRYSAEASLRTFTQFSLVGHDSMERNNWIGRYAGFRTGIISEL